MSGKPYKFICDTAENALPTLEDCSVDSIVTDPPAGIGFMGKDWDKDKGGRDQWIAWLESIMVEAGRVLKPGGHALVWALPRTQHWTATAIENAGFEIRDVINHLFGSGFPKSLDVSKAIDKVSKRLGMFGPFAKHYTERQIASGLTHSAICEVGKFYDEHNHGGASVNWGKGYNVPTLEQWQILKPLLGLSTDFQPLIERIEAQREVIGEKNTNKTVYQAIGQTNESGQIDITTPATPEAKQWDGWGTALKPACENWILARKPFNGNVASNVLEHGTGAINVDGCRIDISKDDVNLRINAKNHNWNQDKSDFGLHKEKSHRANGDLGFHDTKGRFPSNVILSHSLDCGASCVEGCPVRELDEQSGKLRSGNNCTRTKTGSFLDHGGLGSAGNLQITYGDFGGASRFFYQAKPSKAERNLGLEGFDSQRSDYRPNDDKRKNTIRERLHNSRPKANHHPTVKSLSLMRYLVRLVTPKGGTVLDHFCGSGTTGMACMIEGFDFIGIDSSPEYIEIAKARTKAANCEPKDFVETISQTPRKEIQGQDSLFD